MEESLPISTVYQAGDVCGQVEESGPEFLFAKSAEFVKFPARPFLLHGLLVY
jgi:hypothetical protein